MSYASPQPASGSSGTLVLVTIGVCVASLLELVGVVVLYFVIVGGMFYSKINELQRFEKAQAARDQQIARDQAELSRRQAEMQRTRNTPPRNVSTPTPNAPASATPYANSAQVGVNDRVYILWSSTWYPGTILENRGRDFKIRYDNYSSTFDEYVSLDRLRRMSPTDAQYRVPNASPPNLAGQPKSPSANLNPRNLSAPFSSARPPQDGRDRPWRNRSGEVIFQGQLYANYGNAVRLMSQSGFSMQSIPVDASLLSAEDQAYAKRFPVLSPDEVMSSPARPPITPGTPDQSTAQNDARTRAEEARQEAERRFQEVRERIERERAERMKSFSSPSTPGKQPGAGAPDPLQGMRTWSDSTGRFNLEAELIGVVGGSVQLRRKDGRIVTMEIDKLSPSDRALVRAKYPRP